MSPREFITDRKVYGLRYAVHRFYQRRHVPLIAYLVLAFMTGYSFKVERDHSNQNRAQLAQQTHSVLVSGCERNNALRISLQEILRSGIPQTQQYVKDGTITQVQADRSILLTKAAIRRVAPLDCEKQYPLSKRN